jgi:hypothetical protein
MVEQLRWAGGADGRIRLIESLAFQQVAIDLIGRPDDVTVVEICS